MTRESEQDLQLKQNAHRVDLAPFIQQVKDGTFHINPAFDSKVLRALVRGTLRISPDSANTLWKGMKIERNARIAQILEVTFAKMKPDIELVCRAVVERVELKNNHVSVPSLLPIFERRLRDTLTQRQRNVDSEQAATWIASIQRLNNIVEFGADYGLWNFSALPSVDKFIIRGYMTSAEFLAGFFQLLIVQFRKHDIPLTKESLLRGVESALPAMHILSSMNLSHGPEALRAIQKVDDVFNNSFGVLNESYFTFDPVTLRLRLNMDRIRAIRSSADSDQLLLNDEPYAETTGCPARYLPFIFEELARMTATVLGTYIETNAKQELERGIFEKSIENFLIYILKR